MANGRTAAECYALGLDPTLATNDFRIVSIELVDGKPKVEWEPKVNRWTGAEIQAVLKGAATLEGQWEEVPDGGGSPHQMVATERDPPGSAAKMLGYLPSWRGGSNGGSGASDAGDGVVPAGKGCGTFKVADCGREAAESADVGL